MSDLKEQLAAIRSLVSKAQISDAPTPTSSQAAPKEMNAGERRALPPSSGDALLRKCLERLLSVINGFDGLIFRLDDGLTA
jgi:hypothetical protein